MNNTTNITNTTKKHKHFNVAFFIPHLGCPHNCSFCDQKTISGNEKPVSLDEVKTGIISALAHKKILEEQGVEVFLEICFFGGSFTAIKEEYIHSYLSLASSYLVDNSTGAVADGIRISTRPDYINDSILNLLKSYGVSAIEIGCQSTSDNILAINGRGHCKSHIINACKMIKAHGFELGCQMMAGLYGDTKETILQSAKDIIELAPSTVRIYPVVILRGTPLAESYTKGEFVPLDFSEMVDICANLLTKFLANNIKVIKLGLHASEIVEQNLVGGFYHPAFKELCENKIYLDLILNELKTKKIPKGKITIISPKGSISKVVGQKKCNLNTIEKKGYIVTFQDTLELFPIGGDVYDVKIIPAK